MKDLGVVIPVGTRTDLAPEELHQKRKRVLLEAGYRPSFTYVIDGDTPLSTAAFIRIAENDDAVRVIQLSRYFGETAAILAGFSTTKSECLLIMPAFEQADSAGLGTVLAALDGVDLVTVRRFPRCDSLAKRVQSRIFESFVKLVGSKKARDPGCHIHALRRAVLEETQLYGEQHGFLPVLAENAGFEVAEVDLPQARNDASRSMQPPRSYLHRLIDVLSMFFLTRFTGRPLRFFGPIGAACTTLGFVALAVVVTQRLLGGLPLADRPALLLASLLVAVGLQILAIGLIGELIVFIHARSMKQYRIREVVEFSPETATAQPQPPTPHTSQHRQPLSSS